MSRTQNELNVWYDNSASHSLRLKRCIVYL